jgi:hypothetical protein
MLCTQFYSLFGAALGIPGAAGLGSFDAPRATQAGKAQGAAVQALNTQLEASLAIGSQALSAAIPGVTVDQVHRLQSPHLPGNACARARTHTPHHHHFAALRTHVAPVPRGPTSARRIVGCAHRLLRCLQNGCGLCARGRVGKQHVELLDCRCKTICS